MIRHHPFGSGHPYAVTADQRLPTYPLAGDDAELRVLAAPAVERVTAQWESDDGGSLEIPLQRATTSLGNDAGQAEPADSVSTHLSAAQQRAVPVVDFWRMRTPVLESGRRYRYRFTATAASGRRTTTRWYALLPAQWQAHGGIVATHGPDRVVPGSVKWLADADGVRRVRLALDLAEGEHVVGFGERFDRVDQRGHKLDAVVFEQYKDQGAQGRTYLPMPFAMVLGSSGWSFHLRTSRRSWYDVGATQADRIDVVVDLGGAPEERLEIAFNEGTPARLLDSFLDTVGHPQPLPAWTFRLWASSNEWNTQARVLEEVARHRAEDVPVGVVVIEAWSDEATYTAFRDAVYEVREDGSPHRLSDFTFPAHGAWPDPKGMTDALHDDDVRLVLWQIPLMKMRPHPRGQAAVDARVAQERGYVVRTQGGRPYRNRGWWFPLALMPDFTSAEARNWWLAKRRYLVEEVGIDGFKTDGGEHAWGADLRYADGSDGDAGNNLFPVHYAAAYGELMRACGKAPVTFSRAGFAGSQTHGAFWAGDENSTWDAFRNSITAGITASACGILYWGWDIGGFSGEVPDAELYLRATAMACFAPIMQYHSEFNHHRIPLRDRTPWNVAERTGDPRVLSVFRTYAHLRERLVPYLAEQAGVAIAEGSPLMRGLFFLDPADDESWNHPRQYLLGSDLLVAPVCQPSVAIWPVYLPAGDWVDVWTGARVTGPTTIARETPLEQIPVYCRASRWPALAPAFEDLP